MEEENCNFNDNEVLKEDAMGALALVSLSHQKLDTKTAIAIKVLHQKVRGIVQANEVTGGKLIRRKTVPSTSLGLPKFSQIEQRDLPPIKRLDGLIGQCSKPFEKQLTESDVLSSQNRLLFTRDFAREELLPLLNSDENLEEGIEVKTYDFQGKEYDMVFKYWDRARMYHLQRDWRTFVSDHGLKHIEDWISVWMFRHNQTKKLCFAITSRRVPITSSSQARKFRKNKRTGISAHLDSSAKADSNTCDTY